LLFDGEREDAEQSLKIQVLLRAMEKKKAADPSLDDEEKKSRNAL